MGTAQRLVYIKLPAEDRAVYGEEMVGRLVKSMYGTQDASHLWQLDYVELLCNPEGPGGFERGRHNAALFLNKLLDVRMAVHGDDFMVLGDDEGLEHADELLRSRYPTKNMGTLGFADTDDSKLQLLNRILKVGRDSRGEFIDLEPDPRHAQMIVADSGCNDHTKSVGTPREKIKDELVKEGLKTRKLVGEECTRYRSACMRLSYLA